jgi:8-amino-7-oxononanoate synthase
MSSTSVDAAHSPADWAEEILLEDLREGLLRQPRVRFGGSNIRGRVDGHDVVIFSSNDYLGLSMHAAVRGAAIRAALNDGVGATGSRHLSGSHQVMVELEAALCAFEGSESATLAPSGYAANLAVLSALGGRDAVIFSDELNHASMIDGCRLSRSRIEVYRHRDLADLEARVRASSDRAVIVSDTVFSTEGSRADVARLAMLAHRYDTWLVLDEAHATGVLGPGGRGVVAAEGLQDDPQIVRVVTFSKALGAAGAAICASETVRQLLLQRGRALMYSTALPHPVIAAARSALNVLISQPHIVDRLRARSRLLHESLDTVALPERDRDVPIVPVVLGDARRAADAEQALLEQGWMVHALRPPTVPPDSSRLRLTVSAEHDEGDIRAVAAAVRAIVS